MSIFDKRVAFKPYEYPEVDQFREAISKSYWTKNEWNFLSDVHDFKVKLSDVEKNTIKNALLAISQIEVSVKKFWTNLGNRFPKTEFEFVGVTFGDSEARHADAYSHLLEVLGLNKDFDLLLENPVLKGRVEYLTKYIAGSDKLDNKKFTLALALFSIFVENVSLFSQFLVIKSFNKYMNVLKDIDNVVQATQQEECYVDGTEVLTPDGWKNLSEMKVNDKIIQYNKGKLEIVNVLHKVERDYNGEMYHFKNRKSQCLVTPCHEMVYYDNKNNLKKIKAKDFVLESKKKIPHGGLFDNKGIDALSFDDRLKIAIQADGTLLKWKNKNGDYIKRGKNGGYNYSIGLTKKRKKERLEWILNNLKIEYKKIINDKKIEYIIKYSNDINCKKFDWVNVNDKSSYWCDEFIKECIEWDGYKTIYKNSFGYSSTDKENIDKVQLIAILAGYRTSISTRTDKRKESYKNCYKLSLMKKNLINHCHAYTKEIVSYSGKVYCVTVPSGVIITRYKNDIMIAGNCLHAQFGMWIINKIKEEFSDWFDDEYYNSLSDACLKAYEAENNIIDWIFEKGELPFLSKNTVKEFIKNRFNESLESIGGKKIFDVDTESLKQVKWFNDELYAEISIDFFHKKSTSYSKFTKAITADDIF